MTLYTALRFLAGSVITASSLLGLMISPYWYFLTAFVALNLIQSAYTKWCPAIVIFRWFKLKEEPCAFSAGDVHRYTHLIAGVLLSALLIVLYMTEFNSLVSGVITIMGLSVLQSSFTGICPAIFIAKRVSHN